MLIETWDDTIKCNDLAAIDTNWDELKSKLLVFRFTPSTNETAVLLSFFGRANPSCTVAHDSLQDKKRSRNED